MQCHRYCTRISRSEGRWDTEKRDHGGFAEYVDMVHKSLGDYRCIIEVLVSEGDKVFAKMTFTGIHQDEFMGYPPRNTKLVGMDALCSLSTVRE